MRMIPHSQSSSPRPRAAGERATLLVFTLGAEAEARRKRLLPAQLGESETGLYRACLDAALRAGRVSGCRLEVSCAGVLDLPADIISTLQRGLGFGDRFARAFDAAHARAGARGPVIAVGTDTPGLSADHLAQARDALAPTAGEDDPHRDGRVVIGPSPDGGFYLLASDRPLGHLLRRVRWCRSTTLEELRRQLTAAGLEVILLEPLADLDHRADLERWLAPRRRYADGVVAPLTRRWAVVIVRLLAALRRPPSPQTVRRPGRRHTPARRGRAPPLPCAA